MMQPTNFLTLLSSIVLLDILYHGTCLKRNSDELQQFKQRLINKRQWREGKDFGSGFYTTHLIEQSKEWAETAPRRRVGNEGDSNRNYIPCVLHITIDITKIRTANILIFTDASRAWAKLILMNRVRGKNSPSVL